MNVAAKLEDRPLPTGWISRQSKSRNKQYYFNTVTGKSSWKHPLDDETSIHVSNFGSIKALTHFMQWHGSQGFSFQWACGDLCCQEEHSCQQLNKVCKITFVPLVLSWMLCAQIVSTCRRPFISFFIWKRKPCVLTLIKLCFVNQRRKTLDQILIPLCWF